MATVFMANRGDNPAGFYSTYPQSASVSSDVVEMDLEEFQAEVNGDAN